MAPLVSSSLGNGFTLRSSNVELSWIGSLTEAGTAPQTLPREPGSHRLYALVQRWMDRSRGAAFADSSEIFAFRGAAATRPISRRIPDSVKTSRLSFF